MRVIVAGSRHITDYALLEKAVLDSKFNITEVVWGKATGVDRLGFDWAIKNGVTIKGFTAEWNSFGRAAGPMRNREMCDYADALILLWDGKSKGSANVRYEAKKRGPLIHEVIVEELQDEPKNLKSPCDLYR